MGLQLQLLEESLPNVQVARGYVCKAIPDLISAFELLQGSIDSHPQANPAGPTGTAVTSAQPLLLQALRSDTSHHLMIHTIQELKMYDFPAGDAVLQHYPARKEHILIHYVAGEQLPPMTVQRSSNGVLATIRDCQADPAAIETMKAWVDEILEKTPVKPPQVGTFEFILGNDHLPILVRVSSGWSTEHFPVLFARRFAPTARLFAWHFTPPENLDVWCVTLLLCTHARAWAWAIPPLPVTYPPFSRADPVWWPAPQVPLVPSLRQQSHLSPWEEAFRCWGLSTHLQQG